MKFRDMSFEQQTKIAKIIFIIILIIFIAIFVLLWNNAKYKIEHIKSGDGYYKYSRVNQLEDMLIKNKESIDYVLDALLNELDEPYVSVCIPDIKNSYNETIKKYEKELYELYANTKIDYINIYKKENCCFLEQISHSNMGIELVIRYDVAENEYTVINRTNSDNFWINLYDFLYNGYHRNYEEEQLKSIEKLFQQVEKHIE